MYKFLNHSTILHVLISVININCAIPYFENFVNKNAKVNDVKRTLYL